MDIPQIGKSHLENLFYFTIIWTLCKGFLVKVNKKQREKIFPKKYTITDAVIDFNQDYPYFPGHIRRPAVQNQKK